MPTIAIVDGVRIMIFPFDHDPAHVRAVGSDFRLKLAIADGALLEARGTIRPAALRRLQIWVGGHRPRLQELWASASSGRAIGRLED